jgi:predicted amidophosphoribosyltransferase
MCAQCGASLGEDHRFCGDCGAPVGDCPSCGEPLTPGKRFCHACGHALHGDAAALDIEEARTIGHRLRGRPMLDRADTIDGAASRIGVGR